MCCICNFMSPFLKSVYINGFQQHILHSFLYYCFNTVLQKYGFRRRIAVTNSRYNSCYHKTVFDIKILQSLAQKNLSCKKLVRKLTSGFTSLHNIALLPNIYYFIIYLFSKIILLGIIGT